MPENLTIQTYNAYAATYDQEVVDFWERFPARFIDEFAAALPGRRVLDLGSGSGRDAVLLRERGLEVVCADASEAMVAITQELGFESHLSLFSELDFPQGSFDGVWAYTSLIHVKNPEAVQVMQKVYALLRPMGAFAVGAIQGEGEGMVTRASMPGVARYFKKYTAPELRQSVESTGFTFVYEQDYQPHNTVYLNQLYKKESPDPSE